jgi:hypothetical protein
LKSFFFAAALHYINIKTIHKVTKRQEKKSNFGMKKLIFLIKDYQGIEFHAHFKDIFTGFRAFFISLKLHQGWNNLFAIFGETLLITVIQ